MTGNKIRNSWRATTVINSCKSSFTIIAANRKKNRMKLAVNVANKYPGLMEGWPLSRASKFSITLKTTKRICGGSNRRKYGVTGSAPNREKC